MQVPHKNTTLLALKAQIASYLPCKFHPPSPRNSPPSRPVQSERASIIPALHPCSTPTVQSDQSCQPLNPPELSLSSLEPRPSEVPTTTSPRSIWWTSPAPSAPPAPAPRAPRCPGRPGRWRQVPPRVRRYRRWAKKDGGCRGFFERRFCGRGDEDVKRPGRRGRISTRACLHWAMRGAPGHPAVSEGVG